MFSSRRRRWSFCLYIFFLLVQLENTVDDIPEYIHEINGFLSHSHYSLSNSKSYHHDCIRSTIHDNANFNTELCAAAYSATCFKFKIFRLAVFQSETYSNLAAYLIHDDSTKGRSPPIVI